MCRGRMVQVQEHKKGEGDGEGGWLTEVAVLSFNSRSILPLALVNKSAGSS